MRTSLRRFHRPGFRAAPLSDAVIYELHIGTFTPAGTYAAAQAMLPHLVKLGITHVELMPLATFPGRRGWGYDGVDLYAPLPAYGSPEDLARFVAACHERGPRRTARRGVQPPGPGRQLFGQLRTVFHGPRQDGLGRGDELRRPVQRRGAALRHRQCAHVAARLRIRRIAARRRARHFQLRSDAHSRGAVGRGTAIGQRARSQLRADRGKRSQRPAAGAFRGARRLRARGALGG